MRRETLLKYFPSVTGLFRGGFLSGTTALCVQKYHLTFAGRTNKLIYHVNPGFFSHGDAAEIIDATC
jgi:hypothetical protein